MGCPSMRRDDEIVANLNERKAILEKKDIPRAPEDEEEYEKCKILLREFGCPKIKQEDEDIKNLRAKKSKLEKKKRSKDEEEEYDGISEKLRRFSDLQQKQNDGETEKKWSQYLELKKTDRNAKEEKEFDKLKKRLLTLGCKGIRKDVSRIADLNKIRKQLKVKIKSGLPLQFDEQQEYDKTVEELAVLGSGKEEFEAMRKRKISKQSSLIIELETSELEMKQLDEDENLRKAEKEEREDKFVESILEENVDQEEDVDLEEDVEQEEHDKEENESSVNDEETQEVEHENDERRPLFK